MRLPLGIIYLVLLLTGSGMTMNVAVQSESYDVPLVKGLLQHPEGLGWSGLDKQVNRLGDRVSIALLKILEEKDFQNPQTVRSSLQLIRHSFLFPKLISIPIDRELKVTLVLLTHVGTEVKDPGLKEETWKLIRFVKTQTARTKYRGVSSYPVQNVTEQTDDAYSIHLVENLLKYPTQLGTGFGEKQVNRLGDRVSIALLKILREDELSNPEKVRKLLPLVRTAFLNPKLISITEDRKPKVTVFLLGYLRNKFKDPKLRQEISELMDFVNRKTR
jgi:hypothetical protein